LIPIWPEINIDLLIQYRQMSKSYKLTVTMKTINKMTTFMAICPALCAVDGHSIMPFSVNFYMLYLDIGDV